MLQITDHFSTFVSRLTPTESTLDFLSNRLADKIQQDAHSTYFIGNLDFDELKDDTLAFRSYN